MATINAIPTPVQTALDADRRDVLGLVLSTALPLSVYVIANGLAEAQGVVPLFFAPFGAPGWIGAVAHIGTLPLLGAARWMVAGTGVRLA